MKKNIQKSILFIYTMALPLNAMGVNPKLKATAFWKYLYYSDTALNFITNTTTFMQLNLTSEYKSFNQDIVRCKNGLYILLSGTGQVYKCIKLKNDSLEFQRIDSTSHFGYNYGAINFTSNECLYSFGGYGFWRHNGHLRRFNKSKEWQLDFIEKEISTVHNPLLLESSINKLYYLHTPEFEPFQKEVQSFTNNSYLVCSLELLSGKQKVLGIANTSILSFENDAPLYFSIPFLEGCFIRSNRGLFLLKYSKNQVYKLTSKTIQQKILEPSSGKIQYAFASKNKLFMVNEAGEFDSVSVSMNDFQLMDEKIYTEPPIQINYQWVSFSVIVVSLMAWFIYRESKFNSLLKTLQNNGSFLHASSDERQFTELEKLLLEEFIKARKEGATITVATMNTLLGLNKKSLEVQKKTRNELVNSINNKHKKNNVTEEDLIIRVRSSVDKRYFEYVLNDG